MQKKDYIIWGATGQALVIEEALFNNEYNLIAIFENANTVASPFENVPIFYGKEGFFTWKKNLSNYSEISFVVAVGGARGQDRSTISEFLKNEGLNNLNVIHKTAYVARNVNLGRGVQILANATICARSKIGNNVIMNTSSHIDHECILSNGVHIGPGASLAGCVEVGENSFIGTNATILPRIKIGKNVTVGAGAVVTKNVEDDAVVVGNPAKNLIQ